MHNFQITHPFSIELDTLRDVPGQSADSLRYRWYLDPIENIVKLRLRMRTSLYTQLLPYSLAYESCKNKVEFPVPGSWKATLQLYNTHLNTFGGRDYGFIVDLKRATPGALSVGMTASYYKAYYNGSKNYLCIDDLTSAKEFKSIITDSAEWDTVSDLTIVDEYHFQFFVVYNKAEKPKSKIDIQLDFVANEIRSAIKTAHKGNYNELVLESSIGISAQRIIDKMTQR